MIPSANRRNAKFPASGRKASAACGGLDVGHAAGAKRRGGAEDDAERDNVRETHAQVRIDLDPPQMCCGTFGRVRQRAGRRIGIELFDFLRRLPEKKIGADGRAENRDDHRQVFGRQREMRRHRVRRYFAPWNVDRQHQQHIGQQRHCEPLEVAHVASVRQEDLQQQANGAERDRVHMRRTADDEAQGIAHCGDVGGDVDRVGDDEQSDDTVQHGPRKVLADVCRKAVAGDAADARADHLDPDHQRIREQHRPQRQEAELRTGLRVRGDPGRIVVRGPGDEPGTQLLQPVA